MAYNRFMLSSDVVHTERFAALGAEAYVLYSKMQAEADTWGVVANPKACVFWLAGMYNLPQDTAVEIYNTLEAAGYIDCFPEYGAALIVHNWISNKMQGIKQRYSNPAALCPNSAYASTVLARVFLADGVYHRRTAALCEDGALYPEQGIETAKPQPLSCEAGTGSAYLDGESLASLPDISF